MADQTHPNSFGKDFAAATGVYLKSDVAGSSVSHFAIGGQLRCYCDVESLPELQAVIRFLENTGFPYRVLGNGSNILIPDEGISDVVIHLGHGFRTFDVLSDGRFSVAAGMPLMGLSRQLCDEGFSGIEFAGGIPASVGGALRMNAGAHGGSMSAIVRSATFVSPKAEIVHYERSDFRFSYRQSGIPDGFIAVSLELELVPSNRDKTRALRKQMLDERRVRQPLRFASAGSIFANPSPEKSAGFLIEQAGLKGRRIGGAMISEMHADWIVNPEKKAKASDVKALMELCRCEVLERFGVELKSEIVVW